MVIIQKKGRFVKLRKNYFSDFIGINGLFYQGHQLLVEKD